MPLAFRRSTALVIATRSPIDRSSVIEKRRSTIAGWGVFATRPIPKNARIVDYAGEKIDNRESLKREARYLKQRHIWCFKLNRLHVRDAAVGGNIARFINHACRPNCYTQVVGDTIWIRAARNIRRGEELTYDYATEGDGDIQCHCRPGCRTRF
jgi:SET domain-containing protein